jgi:hypothetical protein
VRKGKSPGKESECKKRLFNFRELTFVSGIEAGSGKRFA